MITEVGSSSLWKPLSVDFHEVSRPEPSIWAVPGEAPVPLTNGVLLVVGVARQELQVLLGQPLTRYFCPHSDLQGQTFVCVTSTLNTR